MRKFLNPVRLLFYFLAILVFFILGMLLASVSGAAVGQGLAGGAIVVGYGAMAAALAFVAAVVTVPLVSHKLAVTLNKITGLMLLGLVLFLTYKILTKEKKEKENLVPKPVTSMLAQATKPAQTSRPVQQQPLGIGLLTPRFSEQNMFYFYPIPNLSKGLDEHLPVDSLVFRHTENGYDIQYAPPWFMPEIQKMDYESLYLRVVSLHQDFVEVVGNTTTGQTAWMSRYASEVLFWPTFLLRINSVEAISTDNNPLRVKPLTHASPLSLTYAFLRPIQVQSQWIQVALLNNALEETGTGWLRWHNNENLLIRFSLFS